MIMKTEYRTGCPCGHILDDDCIRHKPIPYPAGCGNCTALDLQQIDSARRQHYYCTGTSCARQSLGLETAR